MQPSRASKGLWLRRDFLGEQTRREHQTVVIWDEHRLFVDLPKQIGRPSSVHMTRPP